MNKFKKYLSDMCQTVQTTAFVSLAISILLMLGGVLFNSDVIVAMGCGAGIPSCLIYIQAWRADIYLERLEDAENGKK